MGYEKELPKLVEKLNQRIRIVKTYRGLWHMLNLLRPIQALLKVNSDSISRNTLVSFEGEIIEAIDENQSEHWLGAMNILQGVFTEKKYQYLGFVSNEIEAITRWLNAQEKKAALVL